MTKLAAVALILALPGLVTADFYRLRPSPDLAQLDALPWNVRILRPEPTAVRSVLPSWANTYTASPAERSSNRVLCPCPASQHLSLCLSQPDCLTHANTPILWLHAPRTDEQRTAAKEPSTEQARVQDEHPANWRRPRAFSRKTQAAGGDPARDGSDGHRKGR
jgi:hypothetical protein